MSSRVHRAILDGIATALVPVASLCLRHSLKIQSLTEAVKLAFIRAAEKAIQDGGDSLSVSRVSVMTGINRRDVTRLQKVGISEDRTPDLTSRILNNWNTSADFTTKQGKPRVLTSEGTSSEFSELVRTVSADVAPYTVLYELERLGLVTKKDGKVSLRSRIHVSLPGDFEEGFQMLGEDVADLTRAVEENIFMGETETANLHLKTEFNNLLAEDLPKIREWLLNEGSAFHRKVRNHLSKFDLDLNPKRAKGKKGGARATYVSYSLSAKPVTPEEEE